MNRTERAIFWVILAAFIVFSALAWRDAIGESGEVGVLVLPMSRTAMIDYAIEVTGQLDEHITHCQEFKLYDSGAVICKQGWRHAPEETKKPWYARLLDWWQE